MQQPQAFLSDITTDNFCNTCNKMNEQEPVIQMAKLCQLI